MYIEYSEVYPGVPYKFPTVVVGVFLNQMLLFCKLSKISHLMAILIFEIKSQNS